MARITISFKTDNAAFEEDPGVESARILSGLVDRIEAGALTPGESIVIRDINGNPIGVAGWSK